MTAPRLMDDGALPALRDAPGGPEPDATSFITALGLRALARGPRSPSRDAIAERMLDFLTLCETAAPPGAFAFWPQAARPDWAAGVPPDSDDTALCLSALLRAGRIGRAEALRRLARTVLPRRATRLDAYDPPWISHGAYLTWLTPDSAAPNAVDCAANANILALIAELGMTGAPGAEAASRTILDGLAWAGADRARIRALTPFYPDPREFALALENAADAGCEELHAPAAALRRAAPGLPGPDAVLCSGAYLGEGWRSPALHALRAALAAPTPSRPLQETPAP